MNRMKFFQIVVLINLVAKSAFAIPNCYIYKDDEKCYEACKEAEKAIQHAQGSKASQEHFLKSIELCPELAYSFFEQSVPYAKRGQMNLWIELIDVAVELEPEKYLGQRGWYHWFFMHNYEKAISDIDKLDELLSYDIGETGDGFYHLNIMKGLCYKGLGDYEKAINLIENCIASEEYYQGSYDNLHLGVLYLEINEPEKALVEFKKQMDFNDVSEAYFYSAKAYQQLNNPQKTLSNFNLALEKYDQGIAMHNPYRQLMDEIYRLDIEEELESVADQVGSRE
jgi:tetratricopeptide (TPR) repeat protein